MTPWETTVGALGLVAGAALGIAVLAAIGGSVTVAAPAGAVGIAVLAAMVGALPPMPERDHPRRWRRWHRRGPWMWAATLAPLGVPTVDSTPRVLNPTGTWRTRQPGPVPLFRPAGRGHGSARLVGRVDWAAPDGGLLRAGGLVHDRGAAARMFGRWRRLYPAPFIGALDGGPVPVEDGAGTLTLPEGEVLSVFLTARSSWPAGLVGFKPHG